MPNDTSLLPDDLSWLADAPLFIDADLIERFYDAVVRPESLEGATTLEITEETIRKLEGKLNLEADMTPSGFLSLVKGIFPSIKGTIEGGGSLENTKGNTSTITLHPIHNPQRQLVQLTLHYLVNLVERLFLVDRPTQPEWREAANISKVPRQLVFLNLPSYQEAKELNVPETRIIPTAAEFTNGNIELLFKKLNNSAGDTPPSHPGEKHIKEDREAVKKYWAWFYQNFDAIKATSIIEEAASENKCRISWIDYRIPISEDGETLHLHICPAGKYDTGVLAYNFVKRATKHGLRLVGTLKSGPAMNVLAIYNK